MNKVVFIHKLVLFLNSLKPRFLKWFFYMGFFFSLEGEETMKIIIIIIMINKNKKVLKKYR